MVGGRGRRRNQYHLGLQTKKAAVGLGEGQYVVFFVGADETRAIKILEARVHVSGVIGSEVSKRKGSESLA